MKLGARDVLDARPTVAPAPLQEAARPKDVTENQGRLERREKYRAKNDFNPTVAGPYPLAMPLDERRLLAVCLVMKPNLLKQQASSVHACTWPRWSTHSMPPADKTC